MNDEDKAFLARELQRAMQTDSHERVYLGDMPESIWRNINTIRIKLGVKLINSQCMYIYPKVIKKLLTNRLEHDRMSIEQVVKIAKETLFSKKSVVMLSRFAHIQVIALTDQDNLTAYVVYIGEHKGAVSIKSIYINDVKDINNQALEGGRQPSSKPVGSRSTNFSGPQGFSC